MGTLLPPVPIPLLVLSPDTGGALCQGSHVLSLLCSTTADGSRLSQHPSQSPSSSSSLIGTFPATFSVSLLCGHPQPARVFLPSGLCPFCSLGLSPSTRWFTPRLPSGLIHLSSLRDLSPDGSSNVFFPNRSYCSSLPYSRHLSLSKHTVCFTHFYCFLPFSFLSIENVSSMRAGVWSVLFSLKL